MATKVHFSTETPDNSTWLGYGSSIHKNPADPYGNLEATSNEAEVTCKVCLNKLAQLGRR